MAGPRQPVNGSMLGAVASSLIEDFTRRFEWDEMWDRPISEGSAFEWTMTAALVAELEKEGWEYSFPILDAPDGRFLFPLRNEIPYQFGALAGHAGALQHELPLHERFFQAFVPKAVMRKNDAYISLFREGCPYHKIMTGKNYVDRPDILFLRGRPTTGFPRFKDEAQHDLQFSFVLEGGLEISGDVTVMTSRTLPCGRREPAEGMNLEPVGIVECSVNKTWAIAGPQLDKYSELFGLTSPKEEIALVTANKLTEGDWPHVFVCIESEYLEGIAEEFRSAADYALRLFGLI